MMWDSAVRARTTPGKRAEAALSAGRLDHEAEVHQPQRQGPPEGELARHRGFDVAAEDGVTLHEHVAPAGHGGNRGNRPHEAHGPHQEVCSRRQGYHPGGRHQLEGNAVRHDDVESHDGQNRQWEIEVQHREPGVPVVAPAKDATVADEVVPNERRKKDVGTHVATRGGVGHQHEVGPHDAEHQKGCGTDDDERCDLLGGPAARRWKGCGHGPRE